MLNLSNIMAKYPIIKRFIFPFKRLSLKKLLLMFFAKPEARIYPLFLCISYVAISNIDSFSSKGSTFGKYTVFLCIPCVERIVVENFYDMIMYSIFELNPLLCCSPRFANFLSLMVYLKPDTL